MEDAQLARYPALAEEAARMLLTNRALATALIQLHSNHGRYAELCRFLDDKVAAMVDEAVRFQLNEPSGDESEDDGIPAWSGDPAVCAGTTQKGKACTRPGTLDHDGKPFCSQHYPYPASYHEERERHSRAWSEYFEHRRGALDRYQRLEQMLSGLSGMNRDLSGALRALGIPEPAQPDGNPPPPATRTMHVDGLRFEFTPAAGRPNEEYVRRPLGRDFGLIQQVPGRGWVAYVFDPNTPGFHTSLSQFISSNEEEVVRYAYLIDTFYRIRRRRELGWFGDAVAELAKVSGVLTTPQPLIVLCGIDEPGSGWRVFRFCRREWQCAYSGDSEAEARWNYDIREEDRSPARLLVDPAHQVIDSQADSRSLW